MRRAYASGGAGVLASSLAWCVAGIVAWWMSPEQAVWALFIGGMLIHPLGVLLCKLMRRSGQHAAGNPLASLAAGNTLWLIFSLPLAYVVSLHRLEWFFPAMLLIIGGRYLTFHLMFGLRLYWALGLTLAAAAYLLVSMKASPMIGAFVGSAIEMGFAIALLVIDRRSAVQSSIDRTRVNEG